jgi:hypothetical protein
MDYVKEPRIGATVQRRPRFSMVLAVTTLGLTAVFIVVLLYAKPDHKIENPVVPVDKAELTKPIYFEQPTKSNFTFPEILKQTEVKPPYVQVYESIAKDPTKKTSHRLQVASFKSETDARELQKRLTAKQLPNAQVTKLIAKSGSVWLNRH